MSDCVFQISHLKEGDPQSVVRIRVAGPDPQRLLRMKNRFGQAAASQKEISKIGLGGVIIRSDGNSMSPERFTIAPIRGLDPRAPRQRNDNYGSSDTQNLSAIRPGKRQIRDTPNHKQVQTNLREIGVTIGVSLPDPRCVMPSLAQQDLPRDPRILKALAQHNRIDVAGALYPCAGVYAVAQSTGPIHRGDRISLV